jgi:uncharacterized protein involved in exopolysaccharide biosynthesis
MVCSTAAPLKDRTYIMMDQAKEGSEPGLSIDALFGLVEKRWRRWLLAGIASFVVVLTACLLLVPQSYTSRLSLSVAQTNEGGGLLSGLGLGSSSTSKFIGVLKSRRFAEAIEKKVDLKSLYGLNSTDDAVDRLLGGLSVTDNVRDGLIYVSVTLPAPPYLSGAKEERGRIREACATAANGYAGILRTYVSNSDFDRDSVLLNGASQELKRIRADYDSAVRRMLGLVRDSKAAAFGAVASQTKTGAGESSTDVSTTARALQDLYTARATLESEIQAADVTQRTAERLQADQLKNLSALPSEDPLLTQARAAVNTAKGEVDALRLQFGKEHPKVIVAQDRLDIAQGKLREQTRAVLKGQTTQKVQAQARLDALRTKYDTVARQIADTEDKAQIGREYQTEFERRRNEVMLRLEVLKAASAQSATLSLQMVSATKRLNVVDTARPARKASPGLMMLGAISVLFALLWIGLLATVDYLRALRTFYRRGVAAVQMTRPAKEGAREGHKELPVVHSAADGASKG